MFSAYSAAFQRRLPPSPPLGPQDFSVPPVPTSVFAGPPPHTRCVGGRARPPHVWLPAQREGVAPALARSPLPMPAPACTLGREGEILLLWKSWGGGVPTSAARSGVQASPFASAGAAAALAGGGSSPGPPPEQAGRCHPSWVLPALLGTQTWLAVFLCFSLVLRAGPRLSSAKQRPRVSERPSLCLSFPRAGGWQPYAVPPPKADAVCVCSPCLCLPSPALPALGGDGAHLNPLSPSWQRLVGRAAPQLPPAVGAPQAAWGPSRSPFSLAFPFQAWVRGAAGRRGRGRAGRAPHASPWDWEPQHPPHPAGGREQWGWEQGSTPGQGGHRRLLYI